MRSTGSRVSPVAGSEIAAAKLSMPMSIALLMIGREVSLGLRRRFGG